IAYGKLDAAWPSIVTVSVFPDLSLNEIVPCNVLSPGLTSAISVRQPPPSTKCGNTAAEPVGDVAERFATGNVVSRSSPRSFVNCRRATAATLEEELNVNVPTNGFGGLLKGA